MWWMCTKAKEYCKNIHKIIQEMVNCSVPFKLELFLLNIMTTIQDNTKKYLLTQVVMAEKILYEQMWKKVEIPDNVRLIDKLYETAEIDLLTERLKEGNWNKIKIFWKPFYDWLENLKWWYEKFKVHILFFFIYCLTFLR